jgi:predicted nucleic-acid-binding protein
MTIDGVGNPALADSSVLVRSFVGDATADINDAVRTLVLTNPHLIVSRVALLETWYVLTKSYMIDRATAVDGFTDLLHRDNISVSGIDKKLVIDALALCRPSGRISFGDALLWAEARSAGATVHTLDRRFPSDGINVHRLR